MNSDTRAAIEDPLRRILEAHCSSKIVRSIEAGGDHIELWSHLEASGFLDALVSEEAGGAGLVLGDAICILELCGRHAVPVPFAETVLLRGLLTSVGAEVPAGSLTMASAWVRDDGSIVSEVVQLGRLAETTIADTPQGTYVLATKDAGSFPAAFALDAKLVWPASTVAAAPVVSLPISMELAQAFICAAQIGGGMLSVLERSLDYANDRKQFGKPIGKFQAIQHQLAVMAEHVFACRMAVELVASAPCLHLDVMKVAAAKARTSEGAVVVSATAHAIHGAIGFTEEYDLQLFTRRLAAWRRAAGSESKWHEMLGRILTEDPRPMGLDLLRDLTGSGSSPGTALPE